MEVQDIGLKELIERETGNRFNKEHAICCPFHNEKSPSMKVKFFSNKNKETYKCFGCGAVGDAIDFVTNFKNIEYIEARKYLGLTVEKSITEDLKDKVISFIKWEIGKYREGQELQGLFPFMDADNKLAYFKAKFQDNKDNKKKCGYYHLDGEKVVANRGIDEIPYNLHRTIQAIRDNKTIIVCEGEKDVNMVNSTLRNEPYQATSIKGVVDGFSMLEYANIFVCSDTGKGGDIYKWSIYKKLFATAKIFKFINLIGIKNLGDNKDVTDWLESGHSKNDLLSAFKRSLDLKSRFELQQDFTGIYKMVRSKGDEDVFNKIYISNFNLLEATRIDFIDKDSEGVKLIMKSFTGAKIERIDNVSVFDDIRAFKGFLGTMDLSFTGTINDLTMLKTWVNNYFALDMEEVHTGVKFIEKNNTRMLITNDGALTKGNINNSVKSEDGAEINLIAVDKINAEELKEVMNHLFIFANFEKTFSIIGSIINFLAVGQSQDLKLKNHFLFIIGESGGGKSTILEKVIAPILNYPLADRNSIGDITPFALIKNLSEGNYPSLFEEYKPSQMDKFKVSKLSGIFRNLYDRSTISRGDKSFKNKCFQLNRSMVLVGEECFPNSEKALMERSCIVYLARRERTERHTNSMTWLANNEGLLNKLGKSLIETILELSTEDYKAIREAAALKINRLRDRPLNTAVNICAGIEIFNILLKKLDICQITKHVEFILRNIEEEVLENQEEALSQVELMLKQYNSMIEDGRAYEVENVIQRRDDGLYIKSSEMLNQINEYLRKVNSTWVPLDLKDFRKQAMKSGYLTGKGNKSIKVNSAGMLAKAVRYDTCDIERFRDLDVNQIISQEVEDVTGLDNIIPFK
ncbi:CHC2 zinc finger domain-containing protein [Clostridium estertheticum]|uniref:CHC2 zinc finger domain-containing protein n=1 Tax=Clostridium estertheticum TaxID=238834 RepID=UPI001CF3B54F|nr:CHC2 zinc finger domain-containing protein [Clostridium estertheticum]MCB2308848.1 CHC2 zinc finger domain-containing protein [Clostridium estertheticum]MCB2347260.1 CHC2 zinc finger domain-containing protein [Clostridium estertheticum]MCB2351899.1 CHC2 zinc finger domain-containing protein [Clostridium estertheticum]WAG48463.1 CHC2 zinc finger domain-containing protein [Clostridium estertheticum]